MSPNAPNFNSLMVTGASVGDGSTGGLPPPEPALPPDPAAPPALPPLPPPPHDVAIEEALRGVGAPAAKSAALSSLSVQPAPPRLAAVVLLSVDVGPLPSKALA